VVHAAIGLAITTLVATFGPLLETRLRPDGGKSSTLEWGKERWDFGYATDGWTFRSIFIPTHGSPEFKPHIPDLREESAALPVDETTSLRNVNIDFSNDVMFQDTVLIRSGWPCSAFHGKMTRLSFAKSAVATDPWVSDGLIQLREPPPALIRKIPDWKQPTLPIPFIPRWSGLAADTAVFGAAWCVVAVLWTLGKRRTRAVRGRCRSCGYALAGLAAGSPCPECGKV
jgi:hypothetical protein